MKNYQEAHIFLRTFNLCSDTNVMSNRHPHVHPLRPFQCEQNGVMGDLRTINQVALEIFETCRKIFASGIPSHKEKAVDE